MRAGAQALSLLSAPLHVHVLKALEDESRSLIDLRRILGSPPQTTMRVHMKALTRLGVLERQRQSDFPGTVDYALGGPGRDLLTVAEALEAWLADSPQGPLALGSFAAKSSTKALLEGWSATVVRAIAARPLSLTELNKLIASLNYPSLERRLSALRLAGLVEARPSSNRGTPHAATPWLARAVGPIVAAARWERTYMAAETQPLGRIDVEAVFLLAMQLLELPTELSGNCRLAVEIANRQGGADVVGVMVDIRKGRVVSCVARLQGEADAWASGSSRIWLTALIDRDISRLEIGGDCTLATAIVDGLNGALFKAPTRA